MNSQGITLISAERDRQIKDEGFDAEHDRQHSSFVLETAAHCYFCAENQYEEIPDQWPWDGSWWKPKDRVRNLVRAGALYLAAADVVDNEEDKFGLNAILAKRLRRYADDVAWLIDRVIEEKPC